MLIRTNCAAVVVGDEAVDEFEAVLADIGSQATLIVLSKGTPKFRANKMAKGYVWIDLEAPMAGNLNTVSVPVQPDDIAYVMFTSGSTGEPKGVPIRHRNVVDYLSYVGNRYGFGPTDRFSQTFDLTFDLSVHDLFTCWSSAGTLCVLPESAAMAPAKFIRDKALTVWFSVPSVVGFLERLRLLKDGIFPTLRASLFCGEALPQSYVEAWCRAAPHSVIDNLYGPTETTIAITHYRWNNHISPKHCVNGIVPIGEVFQTQRACLLSDQGSPVADDGIGELCLGGSQVGSGYLAAPDLTATKFIQIPSLGSNSWYRTGDLARWDPECGYIFLGRIDQQVKILGHRVELQEIEQVIRKISNCSDVVTLAWPVKDGIASGIAVFLCGADEARKGELEAEAKRALPSYMVPRTFRFVHDFPLNPNGKIDRGSLRKMMETE